MSSHPEDETAYELSSTDCLSKEDMVDRLMCVIADRGILDKYSDLEEREDVYAALSSEWYSDDFIKEVERVFATEERAVSVGVIKQIERSEEEKIIRGALHFYSLMGADDYGDFASLFSGVARYDRFEECTDYVGASFTVQQQILGIMRAIKVLESEVELPRESLEHPVMRIKVSGAVTWRILRDNELYFLVLEQPEKAVEIAHAAAAYRTKDRNAILGILSGIEPAVAAGAL